MGQQPFSIVLWQEGHFPETQVWLEQHTEVHNPQDGILVSHYTADNNIQEYKVIFQNSDITVTRIQETQMVIGILKHRFLWPDIFTVKFLGEWYGQLFEIVLPNGTKLYYVQTLDSDTTRLSVDLCP